MKRRFFLFALLTPLTLRFLFPKISELHFFNNIFIRIFEDQRIHRIGLIQVSGVSRLFINKTYIALDELLFLLDILAPRKHFQSLNYSQFLFLFFILGVVYLKKPKNIIFLGLAFLLALPGFLIGSTHWLLLMPISYLYLYISFLGIQNTRFSKFFYGLFIALNIFLIFRLILI